MRRRETYQARTGENDDRGDGGLDGSRRDRCDDADQRDSREPDDGYACGTVHGPRDSPNPRTQYTSHLAEICTLGDGDHTS